MNNVLTRRLGAVPRALGRWFVCGFSGTEPALCQMALFISALLVGLECNATYWPGLPGAVLFPLGVLTVMELALGLAVACLRQLPPADAATRQGGSGAPFRGREIAGRTVGIVGTGAIGTRTAQLFRAFGAKVIA